MLDLTTVKPVTDAILVQAIRTLINGCFPAMRFANAVAGLPSEKWEVLHSFTPKQLLDEAAERGVKLEGLRSDVDDRPIEESRVYQAWLRSTLPTKNESTDGSDSPI